MSTLITTIAVSLDDSTIHLLTVRLAVGDVLAALESGAYVEGDAGFATIWVDRSVVRYVQDGRGILPASASPGPTSQSEHRSLISPAMG